MLSSILKTRLDEVYPNVFIALRIMLRYPDTAAKRFSKLKLIKTFNRSHMTDSRLSSLAMLSIEASSVRSLDLDDVIKAFACQKTRSKLFCYYYDVTSDYRHWCDIIYIFMIIVTWYFSFVLLFHYIVIAFVLMCDHDPPVEYPLNYSDNDKQWCYFSNASEIFSLEITISGGGGGGLKAFWGGSELGCYGTVHTL